MLFKNLFIAVSLLFSSVVIAETVWIDVRSAAEYQVNHIAGDLRVSYNEILPKVVALYPNKDTDIRLYCRSGRRAGVAQSILEDAGYKNVSNFGSIENAKAKRNLN